MAFDVEKYIKERTGQGKTTVANGGFDVESYVKKKNAPTVQEDIINRMTSLLKDSESFANRFTSRYANGNDTYRDDTSAWLDTVNSSKSKFVEEAKSIQDLVDQYKDYFDPEWSKQITSAIDANRKTYYDAMFAANDDHKYWSQWENADAYNKYVAEQKDYEEKLNFDLEGGKVEIERLQEIVDEYDKITMPAFSNTDRGSSAQEKTNIYNAALAEVENKYGISYSDAKRELSEKQQYYTLASRAQKGVELSSVLNNDDFKANSKYQSTEFTADNVWEKLFHTTEYDMGYDDLVHQYINGDEEFRSAVNRKHSTYSADNVWDDGESRFEEMNLDQMNEDEINIYNYYYNTAGKEKAEEYLDSIQEALNYRSAVNTFKGLEDKELKEMLFGVYAGLDQFKSGVESLLSGEDYIVQSDTQIASGMVREDLADNGAKLPDWLGGSSLGQVAYDSATTISNMLPSIMASAVANAVAPGSGAVIGAGLLGASAGGNAKAEMLRLGYSNDQATTYGIMVGVAEGGMEYLLGHIPGLSSGDGIFSTLGTKVASKIDNAFARVAIKLGDKGASILKAAYNGAIKITGGALDEALEEGLQTVIEPWLKSLATSVDWDAPNIDEVLYSSLLGAISSVALGGIGDVASEAKTYKAGSNVKQVYAGVEKLQNVGSTFSADTVAYQIANKVDAKTDSYTIGKLFNEVKATLSEQNVADIVEGLVGKGMSESDATKLARQYQADLNASMNVSDDAIKVYESLDPLADVLRTNIIGRNTTVYQRTRGYSDLMSLADEVANPKKSKTEETKDKQESKTSVNVFDQQRLVADANKALYGVSNGVNSPIRSSIEAHVESNRAKANEGVVKALGVEGKYSSTETGSTRLNSTKQKIDIVGVASIDEDGMKVKLNDGSVVDAEEINFSTKDEALVYEAVANMGLSANTAWEIIKGFDPKGNQSGAVYAMGALEAYTYGHNGIKVDGMGQHGFSSLLSAVQKNTANTLGGIDAKAKFDAAQEKIDTQYTKTRNDAKSRGKSIPKKSGNVVFDGDRSALTELQSKQFDVLENVASGLGVTFHIFESEVDADGKRYYKMPDGTYTGANGWYDPETGEIWIDLYAGNVGQGTMIFTAAHELTHFIAQWSPAKFKVFADFLMEQYGKKGQDVNQLIRAQIAKANANGRKLSRDDAYMEVVADSCETFLRDSKAAEKIAALHEKDASLANKIKSFIGQMLAKLRKVMADLGLTPDTKEGKMVAEMTDSLQKLYDLWTDALAEAGKKYEVLADVMTPDANPLGELGFVFDASTDSVAPMFSERTWTESEYVVERDKTAKAISKALNVDIDTAYKYIDDINSIARLIADDRARLDYDPNLDDNASVLKPNSEYKYTVDMSTLCAKRLLFTGTFDAIQRALPNTVFDSEDIVYLREMMQKRGYEVACGICYVESTRREIGRITQEFIDRYKIAQQTGKPISRINSSGKEVVLQSAGRTFSADKNYTPNLGELNTTDIDIVKRDHREVYDAYLAFMNARGQAKPKLLETRAEYKGEILKHFKAKSAVKSRNDAGGLRLQSFSDFEVPHLIDMMQIVMDMSRVGLKSQAYTKVPAFAEVFGNTGVKINLSLIAKGDGLDANGNLVFDDVEGINHKEAFALRDKYSKNVGTILVGKTDAHIIAAMADPRIDYIIPFHKSSWKESLYDALGLTGYADYTETQNEKPIDKDRKIKNFDPSEYWDFTKSGDENAQIYLEKCREDGRIPKFPQFQGYPGYWKLLIDFKMYDNDGVGSPQEVVQPIFNMEASERILGEYKGGHKSFPVAKDVVEDFVKEHEGKVLHSDRNTEAKEFSDTNIRYSIREEAPPKNTKEGYKVFVVKDGKLYPPMVANPNAEDTPVGVWLNADVGTRAPDSKTGRMQVKAGGKGTQGGSGSLAFRPGWHLGETPLATQFDRLNPETGVKELFPENFVWALCDIAADHDYQEEAMSYGYTKNGKFQHSLAGLPKLPTDGYYKYRTNPNPDTVPWLITGAMKVKKLLSDAEVNAILAEKGLPPKQRVGGDKTLADLGLSQYDGKIYSDREITPITEAETKELEKHFGTTGNFRVAGYLLTDGKLLDFSGKHWGDTTSRTRQVDHRDVQEVLERGNNGFADMVDMIGSGNIRLMPEIGGINLATYPNEKQRKVLSVYINYMLNTEGQVVIDYDSVGGNTVYSREYGKTATSRQILSDIRDYFNGARQSELMQFHTMYSDRNPDSVSNRTLLANALDSVAQNDIERAKLAQYKGKIALIEEEQAKLAEVKKKANDIRFTKGRTAAETKKMKDLDFEANQIANRINTYDRQLLNLESTTVLKGVLEREKKLAYKKAEKEGKEALARQREKDAKTQRELLTRYQDARKKGVEGRRKTEMRNKIRNVVKDLDRLLNRGTKDRHVKEELRETVSTSLKLAELLFKDDISNADIVRLGVEVVTDKERVLLEEYSDILDKLDKLSEKRELVAGTEKVSETLLAKIGSVEEEIAKARNRITYLNGKLADVFERERARLNKATADQLMESLANEYLKLKDSESDYIRAAYDEYIYKRLDALKKDIGGTPVRDMNELQLAEVYDAYKMVAHFVREANKAFKAAKGETISTIANGVIAELDAQKKSPKVIPALDKLSQFDWNNLKPVYAFERIGSANFTKVFNAVRAGEDAWAVDVTEAKEFLETQKKKHGYDKFDFDKGYDFVSSTGHKFTLRLGQIMSLYAYSKRGPQAIDHLKYGGFQFDGVTEVKEKKGKLVNITYQLKDSTAYKISDELLAEIIGILDGVEGAKGFVDEMQDYLSSTMGDKGNEVSLELYGVKLFKEENYFPLRVSHDFLARAREQAMGEVKIKNSGFTKETKPNARKSIVLSSFMDVWANHVNEMSMYHSFVLPLEDFYRVFNYGTPDEEKQDTISVVSSLRGAHRDGAVNYIDQLLNDLNGGARVDHTVGIINKMTGLFKKSAVFASASVVIQQPSAIARATALVDTKYFVGKPDKSKHKETWAEVKKYAPVAIIKEMGYFDTGMGQSTVEWIKDEKTLMDKVDDIASKAPALADEYAWCAIWNAVKRETLQTYKHLAPNSDAFLQAVGERFTEVITKTQVYDSVLARSGNMRSKDTGMKMATAFMGEPTTSINMIEDALIKAKKGNKAYARKAIGSVVASMILNSILVSIVYAGRDDDDEKTYAEKYLGTLTEELLDSFNPLTLIPFVKDIVSIVQGYDVERSDMAVVTDIVKAWSNLSNDNRTVYRKVEDFAGAIASIFGLPVKNIMRDARAMYNTVDSFINGEKTTGVGIKDALKEAATGKSDSNGQKLYDAMVKGDTAQIERIKGRFKDDKAITSAIRKALRENDSRIKEAAIARYEGNISEYTRIAREIISEGKFTQDDVVAAINAEVNSVKNAQDEQIDTNDEEAEEATSIYKASDVNQALENGDTKMALTIIDELIKTKVANGTEEKKAKSSVKSSVTAYWKPLYKAAYKSNDTNEMRRIRELLYASGLYGRAGDVMETVRGWLKED